MDTTIPYGTDETGEPIESVTVEASRLTDWPKLILIAMLSLAAISLLTDDSI